jgi:high-affinity nickel-transport protein
VAVGVVHGLAGSAAVALLALSTVESAAGAVAYLVLFGAGTIAGMTAITAMLALPFAAGGLRRVRARRALAMGTGFLSLGLGLYVAVQVGFVHGLLLGHPAWIPR